MVYMPPIYDPKTADSAMTRKLPKPRRADLAEARAIVARVFPYLPLPKRFNRHDGPARWVFELIPEIAKALAMRSTALTKGQRE